MKKVVAEGEASKWGGAPRVSNESVSLPARSGQGGVTSPGFETEQSRCFNNEGLGTSLGVRWLRLRASTARRLGLIPD